MANQQGGAFSAGLDLPSSWSLVLYFLIGVGYQAFCLKLVRVSQHIEGKISFLIFQ